MIDSTKLIWHKASDELPEEEKEVIVIYDNGYLCYNHRPKKGGYYRRPDGKKSPMYRLWMRTDGVPIQVALQKGIKWYCGLITRWRTDNGSIYNHDRHRLR